MSKLSILWHFIWSVISIPFALGYAICAYFAGGKDEFNHAVNMFTGRA